MTPLWITIILLIAAYLLGSINSAIIVCRLMGLPSPRTMGSGNPGTTNVLRLGSKMGAAITLLGDVIKGLIPVVIGRLCALPELALIGIALLAVIGHLWPVFFRFSGGKGVATALGVLFALNVFLGLLTLATWLVVVAIARYASLGALIASVLAPIYAHTLLSPKASFLLWILTALIFLRHHANIRRLLKGTEPKIGQKAKTETPHGTH